ncbi:hypothetical protein F511_20997 [Dorcoceras hygrometricum]|uniref:Uncharacterized protein n=1 Tax=Dorcoceras hygrometricum TaxID=472368 RepID=A0A2Z7CVL9_9LAMI|nr:hypothetical protein F511_20997 [Dorcoceras hygrometricum]
MPPKRAKDQQDDDTPPPPPPPPPPPQLTPYERASVDMLTGITKMLERQFVRGQIWWFSFQLEGFECVFGSDFILGAILGILMSTLVKVPVARCGYAVVFVRSGCLHPDFTVVLCDVVLELIAGLALVGEIWFAGVSIQTSTLVNSPVAIVVVCVACSNFSAFILQTSPWY